MYQLKNNTFKETEVEARYCIFVYKDDENLNLNSVVGKSPYFSNTYQEAVNVAKGLLLNSSDIVVIRKMIYVKD